jgi:hypothetical protein
MKKMLTFGVISALTFIGFFCDADYLIVGRTVSNSMDSLTNVSNVSLVFYPCKKDSSFYDNASREMSSDSFGYFRFEEIGPPFSKLLGAVVATKDGFHPDTVFFRCSSMDSVSLWVVLKSKE